MKAMILAAGKGTRLQPLTNSLPKALVPVAQNTALEWAIRRLEKMGITAIAINTHYLAHQVEEFVKKRSSNRSKLTLFPEREILGTGGGLLNTRNFWNDQSFILHNVDVFCSADLSAIHHRHEQQQDIATLLTQNRSTQTKLLIDEQDYICGIHYYKTQEYRLIRKPHGALKEQGFNGIHVIKPDLFPMIQESGEFSIIDCYLRLSAENIPIRSFDIGNAYWKDIGTIEKLEALEADWKKDSSLRACYGA
ncbi:MAG: nucleotidyltransferase family protein [SAR324 cluster bacterium]|nr:nucleotidyltransferase family protein [SAR324 cluster bacterium]